MRKQSDSPRKGGRMTTTRASRQNLSNATSEHAEMNSGTTEGIRKAFVTLATERKGEMESGRVTMPVRGAFDRLAMFIS